MLFPNNLSFVFFQALSAKFIFFSFFRFFLFSYFFAKFQIFCNLISHFFSMRAFLHISAAFHFYFPVFSCSVVFCFLLYFPVQQMSALQNSTRISSVAMKHFQHGFSFFCSFQQKSVCSRHSNCIFIGNEITGTLVSFASILATR